jgi:hypothetical protein
MLSNKSTKGKDEKPQKLRILPTFSPKTSQLAKPNSVIHSNTHTRAQRERERERERERYRWSGERTSVFSDTSVVRKRK